MSGPIVVGVSRRTGSLDAVRWAVAEAQLRGTGVRAVTAWRPPRAPAAAGGRPPAVAATASDTAFDAERQRLVEVLTAGLGRPLDELGVEFRLERGSPAAVLVAAAADAQLLVLDSPRTGTLASVGKTWVLPQVLAQAACPVVVMPPAPRNA